MRLTALLTLVLLAGCHSSKPIENATNREKMKSERAIQITQGLETRVHAKLKKWKLAMKQLNVTPGVTHLHWSSADDRLFVYIEVKDDAGSALKECQSFSRNSAGKEPEKVKNLGENAYLLRRTNNCTLNIQTGDTFISINAPTVESAREFAKDVLASLPSR